MGKKVRVKLTRNGPRELRTLPEVNADLAQRARSVASRAGPGMVASDASGRSRARWMVYTATQEARLAEATTRDLSRAIGAASGKDLQVYVTKAGKTRLATAEQVAHWTRGRS